MGRKKSKDREVSQGGDLALSQSDIFKTLFGNVEEHNAAASSLFSDSNPFRRKFQGAVLGYVSIESTKVPDGIDLLDADEAEAMQPKRKKEKEKRKNPNLGSDEEATATESPSEAEKSKKKRTLDSESKSKALKEETQKLNVSLESNGELERKEKGEKPSSDFDKNALESPKNPGSEKGREKRKRDELEREYEMRKYGKAPAEDEGGFGGKVVGKKRKEADGNGEVDTLVPKEGFDDENKLLRTVFVGNLPLNVKKKMLMKEFSKFGEVESVRIRSVPLADTKKPRKGAIMEKKINEKADSVHAYVVFKTEQSAEASLAHNMAVVAGNHIRVDRACPPRKKLKGENALLYDNKRTVFVGNLPFDVKDEEIYQLFCSINNLESIIEAVRVIRDPQFGMGKGIAYVLFKTREAANMVLKKRTLKLRDRELRLSHARPDSTLSKRKNLSNGETANSPNKKFVVDSGDSSGNKNKSNSKATMSYQGLRASKSDVNKKLRSKGNSSVKAKFTTSSGEKPKERKTKRPAVAARKAKADAGALKQAGSKRKLDSHTHERSAHKKKAKRRFRQYDN